LTPPKPGSGGRTVLRGPERPLAANSVSSLVPTAFSHGRASLNGRLRTGIGSVNPASLRWGFGLEARGFGLSAPSWSSLVLRPGCVRKADSPHRNAGGAIPRIDFRPCVRVARISSEVYAA